VRFEAPRWRAMGTVSASCTAWWLALVVLAAPCAVPTAAVAFTGPDGKPCGLMELPKSCTMDRADHFNTTIGAGEMFLVPGEAINWWPSHVSV
jgi:hypothetical protein